MLELKHQVDGLSNDNFRQILNYVKYWDVRLGLLINYAMESAIIERVLNELRPIETIEDYGYIRDSISDAHRPVLRAIRDGLFELRDRIGTGYSDSVCRNLALVEFQFRGLNCDANALVVPEFHDRELPQSSISPILVNNLVCVQIEAVRDEISARARRAMQTHLRLTGCELGLIVLFGKTKFVIQGVRR